MKRRSAPVNVEGGKWRRPVKRNTKNLSDNLYGGSVVYIKLLLLWALVLLSDYFLEFRFEYLWPFWLFLRSVYDSFKYQGLAFSVFFICIAITSDMICFLFIPVHWLFFAASTYVWVQYVWHTEKGVCLPTIVLWLLFVYIEAAIRLKEFKAHVDLRNLPFHLDLCRPFAAHCIGYPVVTLGFGFKSYVGYRMRQRRQKEVQKENEYYYEFLREALPPGQIREEAFNPHPSPKPCLDDRGSSENSNGVLVSASSNHSSSSVTSNSNGNAVWNPDRNGDLVSNEINSSKSNHVSNNSSSSSCKKSLVNGDFEYLEKSSDLNGSAVLDEPQSNNNNHKKSNGTTGGSSNNSSSANNKENVKNKKLTKEENVAKLESDIKRLKTDLQQSRNKENDLRDQIISYMSSERHLKSEISNLQVEKSVLESRLSGLLSTRASEKATLSTLEKKLADERKQKTDFQIKLETERKVKKEAANAERTVRENQTRGEVLKLEAEIKTLRSELQVSRERAQAAEQEVYMLRKYKETHGDPEVLVKALKNMQEKNNQIEMSLSAETKLKMDLFSALGDAKRELGIKQGFLAKRDKEIRELKAKIAEVLAVMPHSAGQIGGGGGPVGGAGGQSNSGSQNNSVGNNSGMGSIFAPTTLSLDLPRATDLSYTGKLSTGLGLSDLDMDSNSNSSNSLYSAFNSGNNVYKTNGKVNDA